MQDGPEFSMTGIEAAWTGWIEAAVFERGPFTCVRGAERAIQLKQLGSALYP